jgi:DNA polymerase I
MEISFQLLDCDYVLINGEPIVRLFGKTKDNKNVCAFYKGYYPYFFVLPKEGMEEEVIDFLQNKFKQLVLRIEGVQKFLPIGFRKDKVNLFKIFLKDPSQVPLVRDDLKKQNFVEGVFEADILFKYRFMVDFNLSGMKWVKINGDFTNTSTVRSEKTIAAKAIEPIEENSNVPLKYMGIDTEIVPDKEGVPNPAKDQISIISLSFSPAYNKHNSLVLISKPIKKKYEDTIVFKNEKDMLEEFVKIVEAFDPDIFVGYNINNFDIPYIFERLKVCKVSRALGRCKRKEMNCRKIGIRFRNSVTGRFVVDVYDLIKESVGKGLLRLKRYALGDVSKELIGEEKINISHGEIGKYWNGNEEQVEKLIEYARRDADLALKLLLEKDMLSKFIELSKISGLILQDALDGGESTRLENLLLREFGKRDFVIPNRPSPDEILKRTDEREAMGLKGALVLEPEMGLHTNCVVYLDFRSMYPSILISYNICPTTLVLTKENVESINTPYNVKFVSPKIREGILPEILRYLIEERNKVKKDISKVSSENEKKVLDARQYALKIMANAFYGYTGYVRGRVYILDIANAITSCGRYLIQKTRDIVETDKNLKVVYGDTDSIMVKLQTTDLDEAFKIGKEIEQKINNGLEGVVQIKIENVFKTLLVLTKKRYAGWSFEKSNGEWNGKLIMKGIETVRRDWCDLTSKTLFNVLKILLEEQNPKKAFNHVKTILGCLEKNEISIEDLVITKSISKSLKDYKGIQPHIELVKKMKKRSPAGAPGIGDRVGFVITKGLQLMSERAEDPDYVKQHGLKIDSKYYIESQILPPLERVFEAIGINKAEFVGMGKQMLLFDAIKRHEKEEPLKTMEGFICNKCNKTFRRSPLIGRCLGCGGEIFFYSNGVKSRYYSS